MPETEADGLLAENSFFIFHRVGYIPLVHMFWLLLG